MDAPSGLGASFEDTAAVFVHGLFSSAATWSQLVGLVKEDPSLADLSIYDDFSYPSALFRLNPKRRIPNLDDVADALFSYINLRVAEPNLVLVTHSQGGLVVLRLLSRYLIGQHRAFSRTRLRLFIPYACPTSGSLFGWRTRRLLLNRHAQERGLRPLDEATADAVRRVLLSEEIKGNGPLGFTTLSIGGVADNVVHKSSYRSVWPRVEDTFEDHNSIIKPTSRADPAYAYLHRELLAGFHRNEFGSLGAKHLRALAHAIEAFTPVAEGSGLQALFDALEIGIASGLIAPTGLQVPLAGSDRRVRLRPIGLRRTAALRVSVEIGGETEPTAFDWPLSRGDLLSLSRRVDEILGTKPGEYGYFTATPEISRAATTLRNAGLRRSGSGSGPPLMYAVSQVDGEWVRTDRWVFSARDRNLVFNLFDLPASDEIVAIDSSHPGLLRVLEVSYGG